MDFNFNPLNSSIFTGAGTPWGAPVNQGADWSKCNQDVNSYQGFDSSELRKALSRRIAQRGGEAQAQAQAQLSKSGIKGADTIRAANDLSAQQEMAQQEMDANLALQDYQTKVANRNFAAQMFSQQAQQQDQAKAQEEMGRGAFWQSMMDLGGQAGGIALGGLMGRGGGQQGGINPKTGGVGGVYGPSMTPYWKQIYSGSH